MPEGLASIDDLKVVITASTEELAKGLENAQGIVAKFSTDADQNLKGFDSTFAKLGATIGSFRGIFGVWAVAATTALDLLAKLDERGSKVAKVAGAEDEWNSLREAVSGFIPALKAVIDGQDNATKQASYLSRSVEDTAFSFDVANIKAGNLAKQGLAMATEQMERLTHEARRLTSPETWTTHTVDAELDRVRRSIERLQKAKDDLGEIDPIAQSFRRKRTRLEENPLGAQIDLLEKEIERLNELRFKAQWRNLEVDTDTAQLLQGLNREIETLKLRAAVLGMNASAAAAYTMQERIRAQAMAENKKLDDESLQIRLREMTTLNDRIAAYADAERRRKEAEQEAERERRRMEQEAERNEKQGGQLVMGIEREIMALGQKRTALGGVTAETVAAAAEERALQQAQQRGIALSDEQRMQIRSVSQTLGEQTMRMKELEDAMVMVKETGQAVTRGLESAFRNWMNGQKIEVREFVRQILADLALITLRRSVLEPLSNGFTSGIGGLLSGALADGGPANRDEPYLVGERGPEIFVPSTSGHVVPNHAIQNVGLAAKAAPAPVNVQIAYNIDATGAYPESIADIRRSIAESNSGLPARVVAVVHDARERGGL